MMMETVAAMDQKEADFLALLACLTNAELDRVLEFAGSVSLADPQSLEGLAPQSRPYRDLERSDSLQG